MAKTYVYAYSAPHPGDLAVKEPPKTFHILTTAFSSSFVQFLELMSKAGHKFRRFVHFRILRGSAHTAETFCWRAVLNADVGQCYISAQRWPTGPQADSPVPSPRWHVIGSCGRVTHDRTP